MANRSQRVKFRQKLLCVYKLSEYWSIVGVQLLHTEIIITDKNCKGQIETVDIEGPLIKLVCMEDGSK